MQQLDTIPQLSYTRPTGAFYIFVNVSKTGLTGNEFAAKLLQDKYVATVPASAFGDVYDDYVRMSYATTEENIIRGFERQRIFSKKSLLKKVIWMLIFYLQTHGRNGTENLLCGDIAWKMEDRHLLQVCRAHRVDATAGSQSRVHRHHSPWIAAGKPDEPSVGAKSPGHYLRWTSHVGNRSIHQRYDEFFDGRQAAQGDQLRVSGGHSS